MNILAVDGGQSSVSVRYVPGRSAGGLRAEADQAPDLTLPGVGRWESPIDSIIDAVRIAVDRLDGPVIDSVMLGLTTAPHRGQDADRLAREVADHTGARNVRIADDSVTTHAAAHRGRPGISLWVGTGVACLALGADGLRTFDGFGYLLGDRGGGFDIGRSALSAVLRSRDGYDVPASGRPDIPPGANFGPLAAASTARFGPLETLPITIHDARTPVADIAAFAIDVITLASDEHNPDPVSCGLLATAVDELAGTVAAAMAWIGHLVPVVIGGGVIGSATAPSIVGHLMLERLRQVDPAGAVAIAANSALDGAAWLAGRLDPTPYDRHIHSWVRSPQP